MQVREITNLEHLQNYKSKVLDIFKKLFEKEVSNTGLQMVLTFMYSTYADLMVAEARKLNKCKCKLRNCPIQLDYKEQIITIGTNILEDVGVVNNLMYLVNEGKSTLAYNKINKIIKLNQKYEKNKGQQNKKTNN